VPHRRGFDDYVYLSHGMISPTRVLERFEPENRGFYSDAAETSTVWVTPSISLYDTVHDRNAAMFDDKSVA
jgi:hypothetical protein